jgi:hypothetical protein
VRGWHEDREFGEDGEGAVADKLAREGCVISALKDAGPTRAPTLYKISDGAQARMVLPDMMAWSRGKPPMFAEVKRKRRWVGFDGRVETGFNQVHFDHYLRVERETGTDIFVFFVHQDQAPTGVFVQRLDVLKRAPVYRHWNGKKRGTDVVVEPPLALFHKDALVLFCELPELTLTQTPTQMEMAWTARRKRFAERQADALQRVSKLKPPVDRNRKPLLPEPAQLMWAFQQEKKPRDN